MLHVTGLCVGNSPVSGEFPAQMASNAENVSIWWRHRVKVRYEFATISWASNDFKYVFVETTLFKIADRQRYVEGIT